MKYILILCFSLKFYFDSIQEKENSERKWVMPIIQILRYNGIIGKFDLKDTIFITFVNSRQYTSKFYFVKDTLVDTNIFTKCEGVYPSNGCLTLTFNKNNHDIINFTFKNSSIYQGDLYLQRDSVIRMHFVKITE